MSGYGVVDPRTVPVTAQPWRCLWRRFSQITMTRPWRRITLHLSQIFLTLGLTFTVFLLLVPVDDPTAGQVVRRQFDHHPVFRKDADVVLPHLAADVRQDSVTV